MYSILDICDTHAVSQLHVVLSQGVKEVFKMLYADYLKYHHYTGKVWSALLPEAIQLGPCFIVSILCKWYMYFYGCNKHTAYRLFLFVVTGDTVHSKDWSMADQISASIASEGLSTALLIPPEPVIVSLAFLNFSVPRWIGQNFHGDLGDGDWMWGSFRWELKQKVQQR